MRATQRIDGSAARRGEMNDVSDPAIAAGRLHDVFEATCDAQPDAVAVDFGGARVTYAELDVRANRLARRLRARGVGRGALVAVLLPRSIDAYAAILGVLKAGAAYVPLDPCTPADRVALILADCGASACVTTSALAGRAAAFAGHVVRVDAERASIDSESPARLPPDDAAATPSDLCYVIYTSGSTGRPKGVMIEHRSAAHLVRAEREIFALSTEDRVYQGFSLAFDAAVEEVWLAFASGATLVPATEEMSRAGPDLSKLLTDAQVTVLSCVPTLLAVLESDAPTVRLLILGGETFPDALAARWVRPGRRVVNTYGPTETTVIATFAECAPGKRVTIGRAVHGYRVSVRDAEMRPVPDGAEGEICVAGAGVARGYVGLPESTREKFVGEGAERTYRTGDLGRVDVDGNIEFLGRADAQIKLRGFRVEPAEIEAVLARCENVHSAAVALREGVPGVPQLVAYVVPRNAAHIDESDVRSQLRSRLPAYMIPSLVETIDALPLLASGKLDRASLPPPRARRRVESAQDAPRTASERAIHACWQRLFAPAVVTRHDDFFHDLGGHSLLAARMVSELRGDARFADLSVIDVYRRPTVESLGAWMERPRAASASTCNPAVTDRGKPRRRFLCGAAQALGLYVVFAFVAAQWVTPYLAYGLAVSDEASIAEAVGVALVSAVAVLPALLVAAVAVKWIVLGRVKPGRHRLWGAYYLRWWFAQSVMSAIPSEYLAGTPLLAVVYRLLGAKIGKDAYLGTTEIAAFDLLEIGDGASIGADASLHGNAVEGGELVIGPIRIGAGAFVGAHTVVCEDVVVENGARLEPLSLLRRGARVPAGETWSGSPARRVDGAAPPHGAPSPRRGLPRRAAVAAVYGVAVLAVPLLVLTAIVPGMLALSWIDANAPWPMYVVAAPLVGASFVLLLALMILAAKWLLLGRVRPGDYRVDGAFYVRAWFVDQLMDLSLDILGPLYATVFFAPWYRALGARLGRLAEISTASGMPDLLEIDDEGFVADAASLGSAHVENGVMTLGRTRVGRRAFVGNSAVVPAGADVADDALIGVLSTSPRDPADRARAGASWLGSPSFVLPRRQTGAAFPLETTFAPTRKLWIARGAMEVFRVTLPSAGFIVTTGALLAASIEIDDRYGLAAAVAALPVVYGLCGVAATLSVACAKWLLVGRYRPTERPLWSFFVWRVELVNALHEFFAGPFFADELSGTPFLPWYFRLMGAKIGRRTWLDTTDLTEFDLIEIGDDAEINADATLQTHLFEDRVIKMSTIRVGARCTIGASSVVLYDAQMQDDSRLDALSLVMKGETLPAGSSWTGIPAAQSGGGGDAPANAADGRRAATHEAPAVCVA